EEPLVRRVPHALETVHLETDERVDRPELIGDEDPAARSCHASELGDRESRLADVVKNAVAAHEVERGVAERELHYVALDQPNIGGRVRAARREGVGPRVPAPPTGHLT